MPALVVFLLVVPDCVSRVIYGHADYNYLSFLSYVHRQYFPFMSIFSGNKIRARNQQATMLNELLSSLLPHDETRGYNNPDEALMSIQ
jgi:hypothetical protein